MDRKKNCLHVLIKLRRPVLSIRGKNFKYYCVLCDRYFKIATGQVIRSSIKKMMSVLICLILCAMMFACKEEGSNSSSPPPKPSVPAPLDNWDSTPWTWMTTEGISIVTEKSTIDQFNSLWRYFDEEFYWDNIDWDALDDIFYSIRNSGIVSDGQWHSCNNVSPTALNIYIRPWNGRCIDEESPTQPQEIYTFINGKWNCIDGWYESYSNEVIIHLGDDPGVDHITEEPEGDMYYGAFCETAFDHEVLHFFQHMLGIPQSQDVYSNGNPCGKIPWTDGGLTIGYRIILPEDEEEGR